MRIFKGLENIHAVIDRHDNEWRREQGEPEVPEYTPNEAARRQWEKTINGGKGKLDSKRFLDGTKKEASEGEGPEVEIIEPIKQEGVQHSWLYNEVEKAVRAAVAGDRKHTKVIAIFVPVIQNDKEFQELPVDETVTLPPVEEETPVEDASMPFEVVVEESAAPVVLLNEAVQEPQEEPLTEVTEEFEEPAETLETLETEAEAPIEEGNHDFNLLPEGQEHPDEELAEAFNTMEEKLEETLSEAPDEVEAETPVLEEEKTEPEEIFSEPVPEAEEQQENPFRAEGVGTELEAAELPEDSNFTEELPEEISEAEELTEADETPEPAEAMSFEEFPVIKEDENENIEAPVEEFIEELKPETVTEEENESGELNDESEAENKKHASDLEPPSLEDFDDEEIFEEPLENLDENSDSELEDYEELDNNENIRIE